MSNFMSTSKYSYPVRGKCLSNKIQILLPSNPMQIIFGELNSFAVLSALGMTLKQSMYDRCWYSEPVW